MGPGPRTLAAMTTTGLTRKMLAEPFILRMARRAVMAIRERRRTFEYRRTAAPTPTPSTAIHRTPKPTLEGSTAEAPAWSLAIAESGNLRGASGSPFAW